MKGVAVSWNRAILLTCQMLLLMVGGGRNSTNAVSIDEESMNAQCKKLCKNYSDDKLTTSVCKPALNMMPRPGVYKACLNGLLVGFEHACMPTCTGKSYEGGGKKEAITPGDSYVACKSEWNRSRPNHQLPWCRKGYDVTYETVKKDMKEKRNRNHDHSFSQNNMEQVSTTMEDEPREEQVVMVDENNLKEMKQNENQPYYEDYNRNQMNEQVKEEEIDLFLNQNDLTNQEESGYGSVGISVPDDLVPPNSMNDDDDNEAKVTIQQTKESNLRPASFAIDENNEAPPKVVISSTFDTDVKVSNTTEL